MNLSRFLPHAWIFELAIFDLVPRNEHLCVRFCCASALLGCSRCRSSSLASDCPTGCPICLCSCDQLLQLAIFRSCRTPRDDAPDRVARRSIFFDRGVAWSCQRDCHSEPADLWSQAV